MCANVSNYLFSLSFSHDKTNKHTLGYTLTTHRVSDDNIIIEVAAAAVVIIAYRKV